LLVFAVLYHFGLECGVGAGKLSRFFKLIRIHHHVGVSEGTLRTRMQQMELLLPQFQATCEQQASKQTRKAVVAMDETFFWRLFDLGFNGLKLWVFTTGRHQR